MLVQTVSILTDWTWLLTGLTGLITLCLVRHVQKVRSLPPGPFPLPVLGNVLELRGENKTLTAVIEKYWKKYKGVFTLWLGSQPTIVVCNWEDCHEALIVKRNDFSGRVLRSSIEAYLAGNQDVAFADFGPCWETLRKLLATAVRKYAVSEKLAELVSDVVDITNEAMVKDGRPVDAHTYVYLILYNILASSAFGRRFEIDDPEFIRLRKANDEGNEKFGVGLPCDAVPILRFLYRKQIAEILKLTGESEKFIAEKLIDHQKTYTSGEIRDFTDAVLAAREEAEFEQKDSLKYLTEGNLVKTLRDLFSAGTDTSKSFLQWALLLMCEQPEHQKMMQAEIDKIVGSRFPVQADKSKCHYVNAFLSEVLRFRPAVDFTLEHKAICETEVGGYKISKNVSCLFYIKGPHQDPKHWKDPLKFNPKRFLDADGIFTNARVTGYMPFGMGRRVCPGEKLALADVFLVVVRLLQKHNFELEHGPGSVDLNYEKPTFNKETAPYKVLFKRRAI